MHHAMFIIMGSYLEVGVDVLWDDVLRLGLVLTVNYIHVQSPFLETKSTHNYNMIRWIQACTNKADVWYSLWTNLFEKEWPQSVGVLQTFLQLREIEAKGTKTGEREVRDCASESEQLCVLHVCVWRTLCASRRSDGCCRTRFCLFPSCHQGRPPPSSGSCSPEDGNTVTQI